MIRTGFNRAILAFLVLGASATSALAQAPPRPQPTCVQNVTLGFGEDANLATLLLREGRITAILEADAPVPPGMRIVDGEGLVCLPSFVDGYTRTGVATPAPDPDQDLPVDTGSDVRVDMRLANRKGIEPAFRAAEALEFGAKETDQWREAGFGLALVSPAGQLLSGTSVLATTREAAARDQVVQPDVFAHAAFQASTPGAEEGRRRSSGGYPSTLMGFISQLRQFFMDSQRHADLVARHQSGRPGMRPPFDADLEAGLTLIKGKQVLVCEAESNRDIERWIKLSDEFGLTIAISGGRDAWRVADLLVERDIPVFMTLSWGKEVKDPLEKSKKKKGKKGEEQAGEEPEAEAEEPEETEEVEEPAEPEEVEGTEDIEEDEPVWEYEEPLAVRLAKRAEWEEKRDCALRLNEAGVRFAFGTGGEKPKKLMGKVRDLVEAGLPEDVALRALTTEPASLLGHSGRVGQIAAGYDATFTLWTKNPLTEKKATAVFVFIDGFPTEYERPEDKPEKENGEEGAPAEGVDLTGTWQLEITSERGTTKAALTGEMAEDGSFTGTITQENPMDQSTMESEVTGHVSGNDVELSYSFSIGEFSLDVTMTGTLEEDTFEGDSSSDTPWSEEPMTSTFTGTREPQNHRR